MSEAVRRPKDSQSPAEPPRTWVFPTPIPAHAVFTPQPPTPEVPFKNNLRLDGR